MKLKPYFEKQVHIKGINNVIFEGKVVDYFYPEDNETEKESIVVETSKGFVEFQEIDIQEIQVVK